MLYSNSKEIVIVICENECLTVLLLSIDLIMSHSGAQGSIGSHSAMGLRNYKVPPLLHVD